MNHSSPDPIVEQHRDTLQQDCWLSREPFHCNKDSSGDCRYDHSVKQDTGGKDPLDTATIQVYLNQR